MRLTTVILIATLMQVSAAGLAQKISLSKTNAPMRLVLKELRLQSGYDFVFVEKVLSKAKPVSISVQAAEFEDVLEQVFSNQPLSYNINKKTITITEKPTGFLENLIARFQSIDVRGRVVDSLGNPLPGVSVKVKKGKVATSTNSNGEFILTGIDETSVLVINYLGFESLEIEANSNFGNIMLKSSQSKLDEVQIIAYGKVQKKFTTSNIGSIKAEDIAKQPVQNPLLALQARVPGVLIEQQSGMSGAYVEVTMQGRNSIFNGNKPFYVVDGVPYTPENIYSPAMVGVYPGYGGSTLSFINPADIESVEFLKDADATAIYGSRAANGAILITTKRGKTGETKVDLNIQNGWGRVGKHLKLLNTEQFISLRTEAFENGGRLPNESEFDMNGIWDKNRYTDWQKELLGGSSYYQNYSANVSGGSEGTQFLIGIAYNRETPIYIGDFSNVKTNAHFNITHASKNKKFQISLTGNYLKGDNNLANVDITSVAIDLAPNAPKLYNEDGSINFDPIPQFPGSYSFDNPLARLEQKYTEKTSNLISSAQVSYEIISGLKLKTDVGYNRLEGDETSITPITFFNPSIRSFVSRSADYSSKYISSWIAEPQLSYSKEFSFGHIDALLGTSFQQSNNYLSAYRGRGYTNDAQLLNPKSAVSISSTASSQTVYKYSAVFGRLNYRYKDKYILNLTARRDGSSKFGSANLFHSFYSAGAAWLFGDENWMKDNVPFISSGKLRLTYGTTGNDQIDNYGFLNLYENYGVDVPYSNITGVLPDRLQNKYLQWEETRKLNLGLDLGLFDNKIFVNINAYRNRSSNQLLNYSLPYITGFNSISRNFPATVQNYGLEMLIDATPIKTKKFSWQISANLTLPKNKLSAFENLEQSSYANSFIIGKPVSTFKVFNYAGVNPETGLYQFRTAKGELTSTPDPLNDKTILLNTNPKWYAGFSNSLSYKGFDFSFLFQAIKQIASYNRFGNAPGTNGNNQPSIVVNRWHKPGDEGALIQKVSVGYDIFETIDYAEQSDAKYADAFYIRLKNAALSYSLPQKWLGSVHINNARVFFNGQNLFTISSYAADPESKLVGVIPPLKQYSFGLQLTF